MNIYIKLISALISLISDAKLGRIVLLSTLLVGSFSQNPTQAAQVNAGVTLQLYAGLTITGTMGSVYVVQFVTNLSQTNNWQTLTNLTLTSSPYLWMDLSTAATANRFYRVEALTGPNQPVAPSGMAMVPAGSFTMGDSLDGETDATPTGTVTVSAFFMDTNLVSYNLWQQVYQWATANGYSFLDSGGAIGPNYPVQTLVWYDVVTWCNARSQQAGLPPVYYSDAGLTQVYKNASGPAVYANWAVSGYRLPTEAEWEKAARGGLTGGRFPWQSPDISESQANYYGSPLNSGNGFAFDLGPTGENADFTFNAGLGEGNSSPVGYFTSSGNGYGLYDMAGNVFEWCWDWYSASYYANFPLTDPHGPATGGTRVYRGGGYAHSAYDCRSASRAQASQDFGDYELGFRTVVPQAP
jgi:formylglycine-generating enzyme